MKACCTQSTMTKNFQIRFCDILWSLCEKSYLKALSSVCISSTGSIEKNISSSSLISADSHRCFAAKINFTRCTLFKTHPDFWKQNPISEFQELGPSSNAVSGPLLGFYHFWISCPARNALGACPELWILFPDLPIFSGNKIQYRNFNSWDHYPTRFRDHSGFHVQK